MLRFGVTVITDEHGMALRGTVAVYAADILLTSIDIDGTLIGEPIGRVAPGMVALAGEWLAATAASRRSAPPSAPRSVATAGLGERKATRRSDPTPPLGVEGVVDPA